MLLVRKEMKYGQCEDMMNIAKLVRQNRSFRRFHQVTL